MQILYLGYQWRPHLFQFPMKGLNICTKLMNTTKPQSQLKALCPSSKGRDLDLVLHWPLPCITLTLALHSLDLGFEWPWPCTTLTLRVQLVICRTNSRQFCLFQKRGRSRRRRWWWSRLRPPPRQWDHLVASRAAVVCATYWQQRQSWSHRDGAAAMTTWRVVYLSSVADLRGEGRAPPPQTNF